MGAALDRLVELNRIDHGNAVRELTKEEFDQLFPDVPPLPSTAFRSEFTKRRDRQLLAELTPWERSIVQQAMDNCPGATLAETIAMLKAAGM